MAAPALFQLYDADAIPNVPTVWTYTVELLAI